MTSTFNSDLAVNFLPPTRLYFDFASYYKEFESCEIQELLEEFHNTKLNTEEALADMEAKRTTVQTVLLYYFCLAAGKYSVDYPETGVGTLPTRVLLKLWFPLFKANKNGYFERI